MLYSLCGTVRHLEFGLAVVECAGVGYRCSASANTLSRMPKVGSEATLYTYLYVREDTLELFGFADLAEMASFKLLIGVSGVGPKAALSILSDMTPDRMALSIASGDAKAFTRSQGIGPKIAQRIVLELKDKITNDDLLPTEGTAQILAGTGNIGEAIAALTSLGYSQSEAAAAAARSDPGLPVGEIVKAALKTLSGID